MVVAKFLAPKGPSGTYSNFWMSRALQSLHSTKPKMCSAARSIVSGVPSGGVSPPTKNPYGSGSGADYGYGCRRAQGRGWGLGWGLCSG